MSVSGELLCSFELLKPLDSSALKSHIKKGRNKRNNMLNSPVSIPSPACWIPEIHERVCCEDETNDSPLQPAVISAQSY